MIRVPDNWNGKLVFTGVPGVRTQYANDFIVSDWVLALGYAFASTDEGNSGMKFYEDGAQPGDAIAEWHNRFTELTVAAQQVMKQRHVRPVQQTLAVGTSNGGYLVRWQLENHPAHRAILTAGFTPGSEYLWPFHHKVYWDLTQRFVVRSWIRRTTGRCRPGFPSAQADRPTATPTTIWPPGRIQCATRSPGSRSPGGSTSR
nr:tannase/feruloyl esterase family alpha/beta hydrolase [Enemella dayhoffiae]